MSATSDGPVKVPFDQRGFAHIGHADFFRKARTFVDYSTSVATKCAITEGVHPVKVKPAMMPLLPLHVRQDHRMKRKCHFVSAEFRSPSERPPETDHVSRQHKGQLAVCDQRQLLPSESWTA